jgi:membrane-associated phospholipid phosphatase
MFAFEWLTVLYAASAGVVALVRRGPHYRLAAAVASATVMLVLLAASAPPALRWLAPNLYLIAGYWLPALLVPSTRDAAAVTHFERWLADSDETLRPRLPSASPAVLAASEIAYLACYPLVPLSAALAWWGGGVDRLPRFWLAVLLSGFACYVSLPWLVSRPPPTAARMGVGRLNTLVLARVSHRWTTFPSGHVAVSWGAAIALLRVWPAAGAVVAVVALGVTVGAAAGRYHYVIDVLLGLVVAAIAAVIT